MEAHYVYRCYGADGSLLYVGCTKNPRERLAQHRATSFWSADVAKVKMTVHRNKQVARTVERCAIKNEHPRFNNMGRWATRNEWNAEQYVDFARMLQESSAFSTSYNRNRLRKLFAEYRRKFGENHPLADEISTRLAERDEEARRARLVSDLVTKARNLAFDAEEAAWLANHLTECELCASVGELHPDCGSEDAVTA